MRCFFSAIIFVILFTACKTRTDDTGEFIRLENRSMEWVQGLDRQQLKNHGYDAEHKNRNAPFSDSLTSFLQRYGQAISSTTCTWDTLMHFQRQAEALVANREKRWSNSFIPTLDSTLCIGFLKNNLYVFMSLYLYKNLGSKAHWEPRYVYRFTPVTVVQRQGDIICGHTRLGCFFPKVQLTCRSLSDTTDTHRIYALGYDWVKIRTEQILQKLTKSKSGSYTVEHLQPISDVEEYAHHILLQTVQKPSTPCE